MLKILPALTFALLFLWPAPVGSMPVPTPQYASYRKHHSDQAVSPFFELTAYSYFHTLFYLLSEEAAKDVLYELAQLPDHVWQSLKTAFISGLPGYISLFLSTLDVSWHLSRKSFWMLHFSLHQIFLAMTFYQAFRLMLEEPVQLDYPRDISTDSMLLNSMLHLYFDSSDNLVVNTKPWPVLPSLNNTASPVTRSLINLYTQLQAMGLEGCQLSPATHRNGHIYVSFFCNDGDLSDFAGELDLYTDCYPFFSTPANSVSHNSSHECTISCLQPEILDCLTTALQQGSNPLNSTHACAITRQRSMSGKNISVYSLSQPDAPVHANFLIFDDEQWFLITGQYPQFNSFEYILEQFHDLGRHWPAFFSNWEKLIYPISMMAHQLTRTFSIHAVHSAQQQFFFNYVVRNLPEQNLSPLLPLESETDFDRVTPQTITSTTEAQLVPAIEIAVPPESPNKLNPLMLASSLQALKRERSGSFSVKDTLPLTSSLSRRGSLPLPGQAGSRRGSRNFKETAGLMINLQKATLKTGRFVNDPDKILAHPKQGMVEDHFNTIRDISRLLVLAIFFRMVNPENKDLVPLLFPSKDLMIKPKSADWNWGCGFLPEDPRYSKLTASPEKIDYAREEIRQLYLNHPDHVCGQQLELTPERMHKLLDYSKAIISRTEQRIEAVYEQDGIVARQVAEYVVESDRWLIFNADGSPYNVIAHPIHGPYIADYDLLMTAVPMCHFYLLPETEEPYGLIIIERYTVNDEDAEEFLDRTQRVVAGEELTGFEPESTYSVSSDGQLLLTRITLQKPRRYVQNQYFKPLELGEADRLKLPMIAPGLVLDYVRPRLTRFAATLGISEQDLLPLLDKATYDHYQVLRSMLLKGLLHTYRPYHDTAWQLDVLMHIQPEYLPLVWQYNYPDTETTYPNKLHQYRIESAELQAVYRARSFMFLLEDLHYYLAGMDKTLGNLTPRMHQLVKQVNVGIDRGEGLAMVHHGCDSANPFSKPGDVCPATGLLPFQMGAEETTFVTELDAIEQMISTLKGHGFFVHTNPFWKLHGKIRSSRFEWALNCFEEKNDDLYHPEKDPLVKEIQLTEWPELEQELEQKLGGCLAPYLYEPFIDDSDTFRHHPKEGKPVFIQPLDHNPADGIGN